MKQSKSYNPSPLEPTTLNNDTVSTVNRPKVSNKPTKLAYANTRVKKSVNKRVEKSVNKRVENYLMTEECNVAKEACNARQSCGACVHYAMSSCEKGAVELAMEAAPGCREILQVEADKNVERVCWDLADSCWGDGVPRICSACNAFEQMCGGSRPPACGGEPGGGSITGPSSTYVPEARPDLDEDIVVEAGANVPGDINSAATVPSYQMEVAMWRAVAEEQTEKIKSLETQLETAVDTLLQQSKPCAAGNATLVDNSDGWWKSPYKLLWVDDSHRERTMSSINSVVNAHSESDEARWPSWPMLPGHRITVQELEIADWGYAVGGYDFTTPRADLKMPPVIEAFEELKFSVEGKLKYASKSVIREKWLNILSKNVFMHFMELLNDAPLDECIDSWINERPRSENEIGNRIDVCVNDHMIASFNEMDTHLVILSAIRENVSEGGGGSSRELRAYDPHSIRAFIYMLLTQYKQEIIRKHSPMETKPMSAADNSNYYVVVNAGDEAVDPGGAVGSAVATPVGSAVANPTGAVVVADLVPQVEGVANSSNISGGSWSKFQMPSEMHTNEFKRLIKLLITSIIKDETLPESIVKILRDEVGGESKMIEGFDEFNGEMNREFAGQIQPFDIYKTKMSEIFDIMTNISTHENFAPQMQMFNMFVTYISLHMKGEEEWVVEQFRQLLDSRYKNSIPITFAVQLIKKLDGVIDMSSDLVPIDSQRLIDLGDAVTNSESEKSVDTLAAQKLCEETEELLVETEGLLLEAKSKIKITVEEKDKTIKYRTGGAIAVIIILIILLLLK